MSESPPGQPVALPATSAATPGESDPYRADGRPFVGIQVGAVSFVDEGTAAVLDLFRERAGVNAVLLACHTFDRGTGGRQIPGYPFPDHGGQQADDFRGGSFATVHPQYYGKTVVGDFRAPDHGDLDIVADVLPPAHARGMRVYAWINENPHGPIPALVPNFPKTLEIDVYGRRARTPCFNHPDYRYWWLSIIEDSVKSYPLDGIAWCSERQGPLGSLLGGQGAADGMTCFCEHCRHLAAERGIAVERARRGYLALAGFLAGARRGERPPDGHFVTFWRLLLEFPEILAWEKLWVDSQHALYGEIYGVAKAIRRAVQVGWHVMHHNSFSPFYRAEQDYRKLAPYSDFIKVVAYHNCAGPRYAAFHRGLARTVFGDAPPEASLDLMYGILGVDEAPLDELPQAGWSADYVRRETARAVAGAGPGVAILPGIDVDIPTGPDQARCTPEGTRDAVRAAFAGGARGVILSRKYSEMRLQNLFAVKEALP